MSHSRDEYSFRNFSSFFEVLWHVVKNLTSFYATSHYIVVCSKGEEVCSGFLTRLEYSFNIFRLSKRSDFWVRQLFFHEEGRRAQFANHILKQSKHYLPAIGKFMVVTCKVIYGAVLTYISLVSLILPCIET